MFGSLKKHRIAHRRSFLGKLIVSLFWLTLGLVQPLGGLAQELDLQLLGTYPNQQKTEFIYAPPYFAQASYTKSVLAIDYYAWLGNEWVKQHTALRSLSQEITYGSAYANDVLTVYTFRRADQITELDVVFHKDKDPLIIGGALRPGASTTNLRLLGDTVYAITNDPGNYPWPDGVTPGKYGYALVKMQFSHSGVQNYYYYLPSGIIIRDFDLLDAENFVFSISPESEPSTQKDGVAWGRITGDNRVELSLERWFFDLPNGGDTPKIEQIEAFGNTVLVQRRKTVRTDLRFEDQRDVLVTDWSDVTAPKLNQIVSAPVVAEPSVEHNYNLMIPSDSLDVLGIHGMETKYKVDTDGFSTTVSIAGSTQTVYIHRWNGSQYELASAIPSRSQRIAIGAGILISNSAENTFAYDITVPERPQPIPAPMQTTPSYKDISAYGRSLYHMSRISNEESVLEILDTRIPLDVKVQEHVIPGKVTSMEAHDGLIRFFSNGQNLLYRLLPDESLGERVSNPVPLPEGLYVFPLAPVWNDEFFVDLYATEQHNATGSLLSRDTNVTIFARAENGIGSQLSTFQLPSKGSQPFGLYNRELMWFREEGKFNPTTGRYEINLSAVSYSLADPQRPELINEFTVTYLGAEPAGKINIETKLIHAQPPFALFTQTAVVQGASVVKTYLLDLRNPLEPRYYEVPTQTFIMAGVTRIEFFEDWLALIHHNAAEFYRLDPNGLVRVREIASSVQDVEVSGDRMFITLGQKGIDIYRWQPQSPLTSVREWSLFE